MTVAELITELQKMPQDLPVIVDGGEFWANEVDNAYEDQHTFMPVGKDHNDPNNWVYRDAVLIRRVG